MTSVQRVDPPAARATQGKSWGAIAVGFATHMAADGFPRGDLAALRRMNPEARDTAIFWRLMARRDLPGNPAVEQKWALILHGIALTTRTAGPDSASRSAHDGNVSVGRALFHGGDPQRTTPFYSETRLNRLLVARGPMLRTLLARTFRMLGAAGQPFDWREMARLVLSDGHNEERAESVRRSIARAYYAAERQAERRQSRESPT